MSGERAIIRLICGMLLTVLACAGAASGQMREPHVGYVYPAGGQQGTTVEVLIGGQFLRGASDVHVTGDGVRARVLQHYTALRRLEPEQRQALQVRLRELFARRREEMPASDRSRLVLPPGLGGGRRPFAASRPAITTAPAKLPEHPLLRDLDGKSVRELRHVVHELFDLQRRQPNPQIDESVLVEVTFSAKAVPGDREIRLLTPAGLTNPMRFQVGLAPEVTELEPNDVAADLAFPSAEPLALPVVFNGQIKPGDIDRLRFQAHEGQRLVIEASARHLVPFLADAVPGWFQAVLALYDGAGREVAFADDYRFSPDPVILFKVPETGVYTLEIRDALFRGREDFVYRVAVGEQPFVTQVFPLGCRVGLQRVAAVDGWNLLNARLLLDSGPGMEGVREKSVRRKEGISAPVAYAVGTLPESDEVEPNDSAGGAQAIAPGRILNGRISRPGDVDVFQFKSRGGEEIVAEVTARRLGSPLDSVLRLTNAEGQVLAWNDDDTKADPGLLTHAADSYLRVRLPAAGVYYVQVADAQQTGGEAWAYRLRIGPARPDVLLRVTPSSINIRGGSAAPFRVHAVRRDGCDAEIEVALKDASSGFVLSGGRIPAGRDSVRMTLSAPRLAPDEPVAMELQGTVRAGTQSLHRAVLPAEDMMQAFAYRHLAPSQALMVAVVGQGRRAAPAELDVDVPVRIPPGGSGQVRVRTARFRWPRGIRLEPQDPPKGVSIEQVNVGSDSVSFVLKASKDAEAGLADNLIVEVVAPPPASAPGGRARRPDRMVLGCLPAIPMEIVRK